MYQFFMLYSNFEKKMTLKPTKTEAKIEQINFCKDLKKIKNTIV